jgi:uncharacterized protein DUF3106
MRVRSLVATALLAVCAYAPRVSAQVKASEGANRPPAVKNAPLPAPRRPPNANPKVPPPDPVQQLRQFQALSPEQREKELAKLPPKRRENLEKQLARFDAMTPVQRERAIHKLELMQTLTPERRQAVNEAIKGLRERYDQLPSRERRQGLARELYSDEMKEKWSPTELELIHGAFPNI